MVRKHKALDLFTIQLQAVDVRASSYSLLQINCGMQWQEAVKVLVKSPQTLFKQKASLKMWVTPIVYKLFPIFVLITLRRSRKKKSIFAFNITVILSTFIVSVEINYSKCFGF